MFESFPELWVHVGIDEGVDNRVGVVYKPCEVAKKGVPQGGARGDEVDDEGREVYPQIHAQDRTHHL